MDKALLGYGSNQRRTGTGFKPIVPDHGETAHAAGSKPDMQYKIACIVIVSTDLVRPAAHFSRMVQVLATVL